MAVDLGKQPTVDADQKAIQQINFTRNLTLNPVANTTVFFIIEEAQETILNFFTRSCEKIVNVLHNLFCFDNANIKLLNRTL